MILPYNSATVLSWLQSLNEVTANEAAVDLENDFLTTWTSKFDINERYLVSLDFIDMHDVYMQEIAVNAFNRLVWAMQLGYGLEYDVEIADNGGDPPKWSIVANIRITTAGPVVSLKIKHGVTA